VANSDYLSAALLAAIKRRTFMPTAQIAFSDSDLLAMADEEQRTYVVPFLRGLNEEHLLYKKVYTLDGVTTVFPFPAGADGEALRTVEVTDASGVFTPWNRIEPGQEQKLRTGFYVDDESIVLTSSPAPSGQMRARYWRRPGKLIGDATRYGLVTPASGDSAVNGKTQFQFPNTVTAITDGASVQFVEAGPGFRTLHEGAVSDPSSGDPGKTLIQLAPAFPAGTDFTNCYVCLSDESPVPQLPLESHVLLAQRVACSVIEHRGAPNLQSAREELAAIRAALTELMGQRTQGAKRHVQNFFGPGWRRYRARRPLP
jgi:hypothetical protein